MNESQKQEQHSLDPHVLNKALERMRRKKSPRFFSANPEFQAALRLHIHTSDTEVDVRYKEQLKKQLLQQFAPAYAKEQPHGTWERIQEWFRTPWIVAAVSVGGVAVLILAVVTLLPSQQSTIQNEVAQEQEQPSTVTTPSLTASTQQPSEQPNEPTTNNNETTQEPTPTSTSTSSATPTPSVPPKNINSSNSVNTEMANSEEIITNLELISNELSLALDQIEKQEAELAAVNELVASSQSDTSTLLSSISSL